MVGTRRLSTLVAIATVATLLLGCGGSDEPSVAGGPDPADSSTAAPSEVAADASGSGSVSGHDLDVCALLTVADLEATTELTWGDATFNEAMSSEQQLVCDWVATSQFATAQVLVRLSAVGFEAERASAEAVFGLAANPPSIVGADAIYATDEGSLIAMSLGGRFVQVAYIPPGPGNVLEETTQLAEAVASRM